MYSAQGKRIGRPPRDDAMIADMTLREQAAREIAPVIEEPVVERGAWQRRSPIRKFTADMLDPWMLERLNLIWPGHADVTWRGRFLAFQASNEYHCICNDRAVLLAERIRQPMTGKPIVMVVLCWSRDADKAWLPRDKGQPCVALYNDCRRWLTDMGGERMICGICDDLRGDSIARFLIEQGSADGAPLVDVGPYKR
jgi:hypothetical protein